MKCDGLRPWGGTLEEEDAVNRIAWVLAAAISTTAGLPYGHGPAMIVPCGSCALGLACQPAKVVQS
jgi:hypothetical protein